MDPTLKSDRASGDAPRATGEDSAILHEWIRELMAEKRRERRWKITFRFIFLFIFLGVISLYGALLVHGPSFFTGGDDTRDQPHVGVVTLKGQISADSAASADKVIAGLRNAWEAENAEAVAIRINSPGGSPVQSQRIYNELQRLKADTEISKPIYAVIEDIGASGAYYVAAGTDEIYVSPSSLVGSIGVVQSSFGLKNAINSLGIERRVFTAGENKAFLDPFQEISEEQKDFWRGVLGTVHEQFIEDVRAGRGDRLVESDDVFSGLIWSGEQAIENGLADKMGTLSLIGRETVGEHHLVDYTPQPPLLDKVMRQFGVVVMDLVNLPRSESGISLTPTQ